MAEVNDRRPSLTNRLAAAFRPKKSSNRVRKQVIEPTSPSSTSSSVPRRLMDGAIYRPADGDRDEQTGERRDDTDLLHGLAHHESNESLYMVSKNGISEPDSWRPPGESNIARLPASLWELIASYLSAGDAASLTFSSKTLAGRLGPRAWFSLHEPGNEDERNRFLMTMDEALPGHLLCFACGRFHPRLKIGEERLKATMIFNPLFHCASIGTPGYIPPRLRITPGHSLPFTFVQLVLRHHSYSPNHGIPVTDLNKRWKDPDHHDWSHQSRYYIYRGHLLMRVTSRAFAAPKLPPSGMRHLLYSREDYTPYFSCCAHWRSGKLMDICKCALDHIPEPRRSAAQQLHSGPMVRGGGHAGGIVTLCALCRPMRRCPECPTEYLVELKLTEDRADPLVRFKQSIVVTRWSDLGDGTSPMGEEWRAINGEAGGEYDSFARMGKRAISGTFEAQNGVVMPGQRMMSLNPEKTRIEEDEDGWY